MTFKAVLEAARSLPLTDQMRLVGALQEELSNGVDAAQLTPEQINEVQRRIKEYEADPSIGIPIEEFEAHIDKRLEELGE